jgi:DNA-directed RNA polymerase specialized sigma24 family protein
MGRFPETRQSVIVAARSADPRLRERGLDALVAGYWRPIYKYLRVRWQASVEDAQDLTQGFFAAALEKGFFDRYDPARARFRTYLRACLDGFVAKQRQSAGRKKRGGGVRHLALDFEDAEGEVRQLELASDLDMEAYFHQEWVRHLVGEAVAALRRQCEAEGKPAHFTLFERYDLEGPDAAVRPSYAGLAAELGLPVTQVTNWLAWARRRFRVLLLDGLREATGSDEEYRAEARALLGRDPADAE